MIYLQIYAVGCLVMIFYFLISKSEIKEIEETNKKENLDGLLGKENAVKAIIFIAVIFSWVSVYLILKEKLFTKNQNN